MANCIVNTGNSSGVNVRASKDTGSTKLGVIDNGVSVNVVRCDGTWATLMYNGTPAFVQHKFLDNPPSTNGDGLSIHDNATCNGNSVNVRDAANGNKTGKQINRGGNYTVSDKSLAGGYYWYQIGTKQWVRGDYLTPNTSNTGDNAGGSTDDYTIQATIDTVKHGVGGTVKLRAEASQSADVRTNIPDGSTIYVKSMSGEWLAAKYNSYTGYIMAKFVKGSDAYGNSSTSPMPSSALDDVRNGKAAIRLNDTGAAVVEIRKLLQSKGISIANTTSTTFDQNMKTAVINFQNQYSVLESDGIVGQCTLAVLEDNSDSTSWFVEGKKGTCKLTAGKLVLCGFVGPYVISPDHVNRLNKAINNADFNFTSKVQIRHFLAQGRKECDSGNTMTEYIYSEGSDAKYEGFYGAGFMQLTGKGNYNAFHNWLKSASGYGADSRVTIWRTATKCVANNYPMVSAAWYFSQHNTDKNINKVIMDYWNSSVDTTVKKVTALVQGGTGSWEERRNYYNKIKSVLL